MILPLLVGAASPSGVGVVAPEPASEAGLDDPSPHTVLVWHGFTHFWERETFLGFHVPHRVSRFESWVAPGDHRAASTGLDSSTTFTFGQSTGVDGDYMYPEGYIGRIYAPDLHVDTGVEHFGTVDEIADTPYPEAFVQLRRVVEVVADGPPSPRTVAPLLQGISFRARCLDGPDSCNSDGIWPYRFRVELAPCEDRGDRYACPVLVELGRAWAPGEARGAGLVRKPINPRMALEVDVHWAVVSGPVAHLLAHPFTLENALPSVRDMVQAEQVAPMRDLPTGYAGATVALQSLGFEFYPTGRARDLLYLGRYIGGWSVRVGVADYRPDAGQLDIAHAGGIWLPRTVRQTGVRVEVGMAILQVGGPGAEVVNGVTARGMLCANSHDAPTLTRWERCAEVSHRGERTVDQVPVEIRSPRPP